MSLYPSDGKTTNIYTDGSYAFGVAHDFEMLWKQSGFLISSETRIKNGQHLQELLYAKPLRAALDIIRFQGILNLTGT